MSSHNCHLPHIGAALLHDADHAEMTHLVWWPGCSLNESQQMSQSIKPVALPGASYLPTENAWQIYCTVLNYHFIINNTKLMVLKKNNL